MPGRGRAEAPPTYNHICWLVEASIRSRISNIFRWFASKSFCLASDTAALSFRFANTVNVDADAFVKSTSLSSTRSNRSCTPILLTSSSCLCFSTPNTNNYDAP